MLTALVRIYRAIPVRPHCRSRAGVHTVLCRLYTAAVADGPRCGDFDG